MRRRCVHVLSVLALSFHAAAGRAEGFPTERSAARPIPWQDDGPFAQPFLQLPFDDPEPIASGRLEVSLRTFYSNSIVRAHRWGLSVDVEVETAVPTAFLRYGLPRGFELELDVPGFIGYAGFLARPIKFVEGLFGSVNPLRIGRPPAAGRFRVMRDDGSGGVDWSGSGGSPGDPWAGLKRRVRAQAGWAPALSWRAALKVPTGSLPFGSGVLELGTSVLASWVVGATALRVAADAMLPAGSFTAAELRTRPHFALQLGAARRLTRRLTGMLQASAHTAAIGGTGIGEIDGMTTYLLLGLGMEPTRSSSIGFALIENVLHASRGADISAVLDVVWRW